MQGVDPDSLIRAWNTSGVVPLVRNDPLSFRNLNRLGRSGIGHIARVDPQSRDSAAKVDYHPYFALETAFGPADALEFHAFA